MQGNRAPWYARRESPTHVGWSSGQMTPRRTTDLDPKGKGDKSLSVKREGAEDVYAAVLQRLSDKAKATLLES